MYGNHLGNTERVQPESLSRKYGNQKPFRNIGLPSTFAESSQTDIPKSAKVRPSAFLKMDRPHRLFGSSQIFIRQEKRPLRLADTPKPNRQSRQRGRHRKGDETKSPKIGSPHTPKPHPKIGMEFQQDRHQRNQIRETLKLTFVNIFRF